jgi:phosphoribosylglycinamide formyltransferase-1
VSGATGAGGPDFSLGVLVSGQGTNLQALIDASERGSLGAGIALVVSNAPAAPALQRAGRHGIAAFVASQAEYPARRERHAAIAAQLELAGVHLVVLAGFNEILVPEFVRRFPGRVLNTHPSLLPAFGGGMHAVRDALAHGVKVSGCTVHLVTEDVDAGPIILQRCVPVMQDDTEQTLHSRIRAEEHRALPEAVRMFAEGRLRVDGRIVRIAPDERSYGGSAI